MYTPTNSQENEPRSTPSPTVDDLAQLANQLLIMKRHQQGAEKAIDKALEILQKLV